MTVHTESGSTSESASRAWTTALVVSVCALPALLGVTAVIVLAGALVGVHPLWQEPSLNLAEAAALKDRGTIQRLIWDGADPNARVTVRGGIIEDDPVVATPLEASVSTRTAEAMKLLIAHGARMTSQDRAVIVCLAIEEEAREILEFLDVDGEAQHPQCDDVVTPW